MDLKLIVCAIIGHSRILETCFGYQYCGRCRVQLGDSLGGAGIGGLIVSIGHNCKDCYENYKSMTWRDKLLVPHPITGPMETAEEKRERLNSLMDAMRKERISRN